MFRIFLIILIFLSTINILKAEQTVESLFELSKSKIQRKAKNHSKSTICIKKPFNNILKIEFTKKCENGIQFKKKNNKDFWKFKDDNEFLDGKSVFRFPLSSSYTYYDEAPISSVLIPFTRNFELLSKFTNDFEEYRNFTTLKNEMINFSILSAQEIKNRNLNNKKKIFICRKLKEFKRINYKTWGNYDHQKEGQNVTSIADIYATNAECEPGFDSYVLQKGNKFYDIYYVEKNNFINRTNNFSNNIVNFKKKEIINYGYYFYIFIDVPSYVETDIAKQKKTSSEKKIVAKVEETKTKVTKSKKVKAKAKVTKVAKNYNTNSYKGKSFQGKNGVVYEGWSKQKFCKQEYAAGWDSAWCRKRSSYFQNGIEVNEWKGKPGRFAIFKDVTSPINTNAWDNKSFGNGTFHAIAYGWTDVQKIIDQLENKVSNPKTINFTIKDKKEQCEVIGFKPQTEKFADCVLRLVELDVKKQQSNVALSNNNSTNNAIVKQLEIQNKQLERQRYDEGTKFLFDLSRQLSQPKSSSWSTCSYIDFGHGMGKVKCN